MITDRSTASRQSQGTRGGGRVGRAFAAHVRRLVTPQRPRRGVHERHAGGPGNLQRLGDIGLSEHLLIRGDAGRLPLPDRSVDLVFGSPPYVDARLYLEDGKDLGISRPCVEWVDWMLSVTAECLRVSRGAVVWVASGVTRDRNYWPACEGLMWEWYRRGGHAYRPCYWHRIGIPGSGGDQWFRSDVEYAMCFKREGPLPFADNTACGHPPKWAPGGEMSHRLPNGAKVNQWGRVGGKNSGATGRKPDGRHGNQGRLSHVVVVHTKRGADGEMAEQSYGAPAIANPGTLVKTTVGGGHLGSALAHENEAPFPESLAEFFVKSLCPEGGVTLDPFSGSGTTAAVCRKTGRNAIGADLRISQCRLGERRITEGLRPVSKLDPRPVTPMPGQMSFLEA